MFSIGSFLPQHLADEVPDNALPCDVDEAGHPSADIRDRALSNRCERRLRSLSGSAKKCTTPSARSACAPTKSSAAEARASCRAGFRLKRRLGRTPRGVQRPGLRQARREDPPRQGAKPSAELETRPGALGDARSLPARASLSPPA